MSSSRVYGMSYLEHKKWYIMWLKAFSYGDKLLSESEFWVLTVVSDTYEAPSEIIDRLLQQTGEWSPKPGTVYPILHRLADTGLLDRIDDGGLSFRRSEEGQVFLTGISKPLRVQVTESCNFYKQILTNLSVLQTLPARYDRVLLHLSKMLAEYRKELTQLADSVKSKMDQAYDVPITFEN